MLKVQSFQPTSRFAGLQQQQSYDGPEPSGRSRASVSPDRRSQTVAMCDNKRGSGRMNDGWERESRVERQGDARKTQAGLPVRVTTCIKLLFRPSARRTKQDFHGVPRCVVAVTPGPGGDDETLTTSHLHGSADERRQHTINPHSRDLSDGEPHSATRCRGPRKHSTRQWCSPSVLLKYRRSDASVEAE